MTGPEEPPAPDSNTTGKSAGEGSNANPQPAQPALDDDDEWGFSDEELTPDQVQALRFFIALFIAGAILFLTVSIAFVLAVAIWPLLLVTAWDVIESALARPWGRSAVSLLFLLLAVGLYLLRTKMRAVYGAGEILLGTAAIWTGVGRASNEALASVVVICAAIYIVVRGLDNLVEGAKQVRKDGWFWPVGPTWQTK